MRVELDGKVLLVTGSTQGVGAEVARLAVEAGVRGVLITGRNAERGAAMAAELRAAGAEVRFEQADLDDPDAPERLVAAALDELRPRSTCWSTPPAPPTAPAGPTRPPTTGRASSQSTRARRSS